MKIKADLIKNKITETVPEKKAFINEPSQVKAEKPKLQNFRFDKDTAALLDDMALLLCGNNKTMTLKVALNALKALSPEEQRNILIRSK